MIGLNALQEHLHAIPVCNTITTISFVLTLNPVYAHLTYLNPYSLDEKTLREVRVHLRKYYQGKDFVLINERINDIVINPKYHRDSLKNMCAVAVVSINDSWREKLFQEQKNSSRSFAFFNDLKIAKQWAEHFLEYRINKV